MHLFCASFSRAPSVVRELWLFEKLELWLLCFGKLEDDASRLWLNTQEIGRSWIGKLSWRWGGCLSCR